MARPVKYTADQFETDIDRFIDHCEQGNVEPTDYAITKFLGVSPTTLERYRAGDNKDSEAKEHEMETYKGFGNALKKIEMFREDWAIRQAKEDPKLAGHVAFKLKQQRWGGWSDRQQTDITGDIKVAMQTTTGKSFD